MRALLDREIAERAGARVAAAPPLAAPDEAAHRPAHPAAGDGLDEDVLRLAAAALRMPADRIDPHENLASYGVDSIAITEIMAAISRFLGVSIAPTTFFEARHLKDLAQILRARYGAAVAAHYAGRDAAPRPSPQDAPAIRAAPAAAAPEPVAIIGMEGLFPRSPDLAAFEAHLALGRDCIEEVPPGRWDWRAVDGDPRRGPFSNVRHGGFVPGHDLFDAAFFKIPPKDAELMDPQHRLFLECVWKLIEGAGHAPASLAGRKVGLFLGINLQDYADLANRTGALDPAQLTGLGHVFCANRLSFLLDIHGPSQVIDTACSSSLVAVHRAVQAIRHEGCEMAIAGGSNLMLTPTQHILFARVGMLAPDGRCKTFSRAANGYARAEGVGAVLMKRLDLAERDGDTILGVIRGSAENHGGAASSLTAPNPRAQARLIVEAHRQAGIDPRSVSYIECHGTGTPLGDPVEIEGLKAAFAELYAEHGLAPPEAAHCGLGSVKSNIGHAETAAGIAGVIKVLLGLQAGRLWQTLHCAEPNPLIDLRGSPFYLLDAPRVWSRPVIDGAEVPRRAAISSFGAGGANAHVVIEEYRSAPHQPERSGPHLIPLSARNEDALREAAARLAAHLASEASAAQDLADIAFTLQTGRDAMRARLACVVEDKAELRARLEAFAERGATDGLVSGTVERKGHRETTAGIEDDLARIAARWVAGGTVDWAALHRGRPRRRVRLPTYPFQRKRFWLPDSPSPLRGPLRNADACMDSGLRRSDVDIGQSAEAKNTVIPAEAGIQTRLPNCAPHELCKGPTRGEDTLAFKEAEPDRFRLRLAPDAFFLRDHVVGGAPTLPGVVYLELMRRAAAASGLDGALGQVVWLKPLVVSEPTEIEVAVLREAEPRPRIEVARIDADGTRHLHAEARLLPAAEGVAGSHETIAQRRQYDAAHVYALFDAMGLAYGPAHRAVVSLACGTDVEHRPEVVGRLRLPEAAGSGAGLVLHPSLMDGAFQCALGMALDETGASPEGAALPFALERLDIFGPCTPEMTVHIRASRKGEPSRRDETLDLDLMDAEGTVRVRMQGFATRRFAGETRSQAGETLLFAPDWRPLPAEAAEPPHFARRLVLLCGRAAAFAEDLAEARPGWSCRGSENKTGAVDEGFTAHAQELLALVHEIGASKSSALLAVVIPKDAPLLAGLSGLLRSAESEVPGLSCRLLVAEPALAPAALAARLEALARRTGFHHVREDASLAAGWRRLARPAAPSPHPWRDGGVYLVTGGAGGIGRLFAREIAMHAADATLILASRNARETVVNGARVEHAALDVNDADAVAALITDIRTRHGRLDGVLHAAGRLDDGAIGSKTAQSLAAVLAPKVAGTCHLDRALGAEPLDLFLLFGSISGALGNPGQADYAAANAFLDAFAAEREARRAAGLCHGRTLAVDWPLWRDGGMRITPDAERLMTRTTGLVALETRAAFAALYDALASGAPQVLVAAGDPARIEARLGMADRTTQPAPPAAGSAVDPAELERAILPALMQLVSAQLKVAVADLAPDLELSEYGFDSISFTQLANALNDRFGLAMTPTVFFEHPTLGELARHFARAHAAAFASALGVTARSQPIAAPTLPAPVPVASSQAPARDAAGRSPIAIVAMSGVFPGAADPEALWRNLRDGRDAIRDAPRDRWDRPPEGTKARGGFIDGLGEFDAAFFGLSAPEARVMDPQQRLLLRETWRLLENAGIAPRRLSGASVGVFVGIADTGYGRLVAAAGGPTEGYAMTGLAPSVGPNRLSFHFNLTGPSVAVETACSSALVAIHRACEAIHSGDCDAAIAGGVNALLSPETFEGFARAGMLAPDGRCKTFSAEADGYGRGEGIGLVLLKRLADAERDGDPILAVIRASAENHGGRASSLTAPNPKAQAALLRQAYARAGFDPRTVTYIEAHGTGTPLGDPIEVEALTAAFATLAQEAEQKFGPAPAMSCAIGSVKSNIGHLELAAGAAGLIKVLLQMRAGTLARSLNCDTLNPYLKLEDGPFRVVRETAPWHRLRGADGRELPRRAGVSSFGFGGSNAHLVIEEYMPGDAAPPPAAPAGPAAIVLSARSEAQLAESARQLHDALEGASDADLHAIAFTLQTCRDAMEHRLAFLAASIGELRRRLAGFVAGEADDAVRTGRVKTHRAMLGLLDSDAEVRRALAGLPGRGRHDLLMELWVRGFPFDWATLYGGTRPRRVALPGYPFARTVHWVQPTEARQDVPAQSVPLPAIVRPEGDREAAVRRMLDRLTHIAARLLETDTAVLEPDTELGEFGFDSITMTGFAARVNEELGLALTPADFFEFATLSRLARHIVDFGGQRDMPEAPSPAVVATAPRHDAADDDPIAIVGMSCCFPGAADANAFWDNLAAGVSSIREIPADRWDWRAFHGDPKVESNRTNIRFGGFIDGVFEFDPLFFGISPREAKMMDPQQRLMMMHAWKALEDAGHAPRSLAGRAVGLFVGTSSSGFRDLLGEDTGAEGYVATGTVPSVGPNRISFLLDWHGPSEPVETACSSSLVALHRAVQAMRAGDCDMAVVGGVNTIVTPEAHINFAKAGMLSVDGACKTFSRDANGYVRGEGVGMVVLKRLSEALRDGDSIYALVRGTAVNHGGRTNSLTAPNTAAQSDVIMRAYARAGIDPATVGYIEAHGTGTPLGDPVEINALKSAFAALSATAGKENRASPGCGLGSVKTNIGHLELAAGIAGLIKILLQLRHRTLAPSLNSEPPNPYIDLSGSPFFIVREVEPWRAMRDAEGRALPRRAGVSSFGFGGVNAHVVLEEYVDRRVPAPAPRAPVVVPLSARDAPRLADQARQLLDHLEKDSAGENTLADLAFTLQVGRTALKHRVAFVVDSPDALKAELARFLADDPSAAKAATTGATDAAALPPNAAPEAVAAHWAAGGEVDWKRLNPAPRRRLHLPTYPFTREVCRAGRMPGSGDEAAPRTASLSCDPDAFYFRDHRIAGAPVLPGVMTLELARAASGRPAPLSLGEIVWLKPVSAAADAAARLVLDANGTTFRLLTGNGGSEILHAQGKLRAAPTPAARMDLGAIRARCPEPRTSDWLYAAFAALGMDYGPAFRSVTELFCGRDEVLARLVLPSAAARAGGDFVLHPSLMDGALQASLALYGEAEDGGTAVPFALDRLDMLAPTTREMWAHIRRRPATGPVQKIDIDLADADGAVRVRLAGFSVRLLPGGRPRNATEDLRAAGARYLAGVVAAETAVPASQIELSVSLDTYGIDSVMIVRLTDELEKTFGPLPKTLFFEHRTLEAVLGYFLERHAERLADVTRCGRAPAPARTTPSKPAVSIERRREGPDLDTPIAVVGLAGRYPGARDLKTFWDNLAAGRDCITEVPPERWDHTRVSRLERGQGARWGGFVDGIAEFDPLFFNISPRDAPYMDPQERLFLECAHEAIEDAGYTRTALAKAGDVGVFVGVMWEEYQLYGAEVTAEGHPLALSGSPASIANRVSAACDFHGPSMAVDSMCSSSLTAIHLACESLRLGTCAAAIAGGVNLSLHPNKYLALTQGSFIASSGRCASFGAGGDGYVPGEGVGAAVLKRLDRAIADGDRIYGIIRGSALNHGGRTNGYTVPNPQAQTAVIRRALENAGVAPREIGYVEAHGTGTKLGDPIEIAALAAAYRADTPDTGFCRIGSVKSNIGHCESAAGIAGLTKVLLQMRHRQLVPSLHADILNPGIDFDASPFVVQRRLEAWPAEGARLAGLSSFGAGGSNAHLIIEAYEAPPVPHAHAGPFVFPFSARDETALDALVRRFLAALDDLEDTDLASAAYVLQQGREAYEARRAVVAADRGELRDKLRAAHTGEAPRVYRGRKRPGDNVAAALDADDLESVARAWAEGARVDWLRLWPGPPPRRISLPTYPFAREIYWVPGLPPPSSAVEKPRAAAARVRLPLLLTPDWLPKTARPGQGARAPRSVVFCGLPAVPIPSAETYGLSAHHAGPADRFKHLAMQLLGLLQSLFKRRPVPALVQVVVAQDGPDRTLEGLAGFLRTAMHERPGLRCQLIAVDPAARADIAALIERDALTADTDIRHENGRRLVRGWREVQASGLTGPWKDGGVYLVTGGTGGLGLLLAERIAGSVRRPVLWLLSRSAPAAEVGARFAALDATIVHRRVDVTDAAAISALIADIRQNAGRLDGIVHAAGITHDRLLAGKSARELREVLAPKVAGLAALDAASADCDLEFMLLFASAAGALGNPGQADYAAANAFMDAFAETRNALVARGERRGLTLAVDWPYWRDGGMAMPEAAIDAVERASGARPLATDAGFAALDAAFAAARAQGLSQVLVLDGDHDRLRKALLQETSATKPPPSAQKPASAEAAQAFLAAGIAAALSVPVDRLDARETFDRYGLNSVSALQIVEDLEAALGPLPRTLLFEYPTLAKLTAALMETHGPALHALLGAPQAEQPSAAPPRVAPSEDTARGTDIAIIAVAGRYPGADTPEALWEALREGRDLITEVPPDRWDIDAIYAPGKGMPGKSCCRWGGFLSHVDLFDAGFFGISPRDARRMDPQERLFLETAWHLLERGGYPPCRLQEIYGGRVGVYVGSMSQQYRALAADPADRPVLTLASQASLANRVSHFFDLKGPSVAVDSMCSSGLEAVHLACQALGRGECQLAIAGAVNLTLHPDKYIALSEAGLIGSHRTSRAFAGGDGYLPAEGVGAVLLKPLDDACADRDVILGVIRGTTANHSGRSAGYGVPSAEAQCALIEESIRASGVDPRTIGYVEAAATGAALGDAIEVRALTRAFRSFTSDAGFCAVGSVKANMGHAEAASGLAQLTKCLFQLQHRTLAPMAATADIDPELELDGTPFILQRTLTPWTRMAPDQPLRAAISSFGAGGTNVHLILEEAPPAPPPAEDVAPGPWRFVLSAASEEGLAAVIAQMADYVAAHSDLSLARLAWTLDVCRERLPCKTEIVASTWRELLDKLRAWPAQSGEAEPPAVAATNDGSPPLLLPDYPFQRTRHWIAPRDPRTTRERLHAAGDLILATLAEETGIAPDTLPPGAAFRDLGATSIFALRMIRACADEFDIAITHRDLEVHDSVDALADLIESRRSRALPSAVDPVSPDEEGSLSEGQLGLWVLQKLYPDMSTYNVPLAFRVARVDPPALEHAFAAVLERFPILARRIEDDAGTPRVAAAPETVPIQTLVMPRDADETAFLRALADEPFDLSAAPPVRFALVRRAENADTAVVLIVVHHIAIDGLSATIVARALWDAYAALVEGRDVPRVPPPADFGEFVAVERAHLASAKGTAQLAYWKDRLAGALPVLGLPADRPGDPDRPVTRSASLERTIAPDLASAADAAARALRVNRPAFFLGALNVLLHRYTGQEDILVGMPVMGRPARRFEESVGCFANMIVMRTGVSGAMRAADLIGQVQARLTEGLDHADIPFAALARALGRTPLDGPLYQVSFAYQNFFDGRPLAAGAEPIAALRQQGGDAFGIEIVEDGETLRLVATYDPGRFDALRIARMVDHFLNLAAAIARAPETPVSALDMLSEVERTRILGRFATGGPLPEVSGTVPDWIAATATRHPDATALIIGTRALTYRELMAEADRLAAHLAAQGVVPGDRVAVLMERSAGAVVALLAVLSAGAVYVPLDAVQPDARLAASLEDGEVRAIVVDTASGARLADAGLSVAVTIDIDRDPPEARPREARTRPPIDPASAAYVIFTSGSTGRPKGVVVAHAALAHHCQAVIGRYGLGDDDRVLQFAALSVDPALEQILPTLISGATVVMRGSDIWTPAQLSEVFDRTRVSVADLPPAYLAEVLAAWDKSGEAPQHVPRLLISGGETLTPDTVRLWRNGPLAAARLINAYGPTEATITATTHEVAPEDVEAVPIGRPLPGTEVYVLDAHGQPVPEGVPGELHIGGPRLAIGYGGDEDLTRARFVQSPFGTGRLYRTGDRAAFIPGRDGCLAFLGRRDSQVKVRGFRIELGEVEAALAACGAGQAAVVACAGALTAFVVVDAARFDPGRIAAAMAARLPPVMCPASYVRLDALPTTPAGKVDRAALKALARLPHSEGEECNADAPRDALEETLIGLWRDVLGASAQHLQIGRESDFFACGGHSLLAVRLLSAIERSFGQRLTMADLIAAPTVAGQARRLRAQDAERPAPGVPAVITLRPGTGTPLFLMHPVGGSVSCYLPLARRLDTAAAPVLGIEAPEPDFDAFAAPELPARAAACLAAVRAVQPKGPYRLGGWSFGGILAYEMARQLLAAGEEVTPLALIDSYAPALLAEIEEEEGEAAGDVLDLFARDLAGTGGPPLLRRSDGSDVLTVEDLYHVPELAAALDGVDELRLHGRFATFRANMLMARAYRPEPCAVAAHLYIARKGHPDRTRGWSALAQGSLTVEELPGDHYTILADPAVGRLARHMAHHIRASTCKADTSV